MFIAGNVWTATTHIITVVVGAGVLALAWAMAQLGWIAGIASILIFSSISIFTYSLVSDCYRFPDPINGKRNYTYMQAVKAYLGTFLLLHNNLIRSMHSKKSPNSVRSNVCLWIIYDVRMCTSENIMSFFSNKDKVEGGI